MAAGSPDPPPFAGHTCPVLSVAFNPNGTVLASGGFDGLIKLWDTTTWEQTAEFSGHTWPVSALAFSSDGTALASASDRGGIRIWDTGTRRQTARFTTHGTSVRAIAWILEDLSLATTGTDGTPRLWNTTSGEQTEEQRLDYMPQISAAAYGRGGDLLAVGGEDGGIRIWNPARASDPFPGHEAAVSAMAWNHDGTRLATADRNGTIRFWSSDGEPTGRVIAHGEPAVLGIASSPDGSVLAVGDEDGGIRIWDTASGQQMAQFTGHTGRACAVAYSPDGAAIATCGTDGMTRIWDPATGRETARLTGHTAAVRDVAYSRDGSVLVTGSNDCTARVWDSVTGQLKVECTRQVIAVNAVAISPDGTTVATGGDDHTVRLYDSAIGQERARFARHSNPVTAVAFHPAGSALASGATTVRIWDPNGDSEIAQLTEHDHGITDVAWHPGRPLLATSAGSVRIWDTGTWTQVAQLTGHGGFVGAIAWSPDGETIASTGRDGTVRLWVTGTRQTRLELTGHSRIVRGIAWSPDGGALASVGDDGTIRVWNPRNGVQVNGTGFGTPRASVRALAGVRSDTPSGEDLLGIGDDVETLAELIAATETSPPLAIALIGDWGAGKSSVMLQVERHIGRLAGRARDNPGRSAFAANVRQIRFNAWHYSDDHLWTGLVSHLFEALAGSPGDAGQRNVPEESRRLRAELDTMAAASREAADQVQKMQGPTAATWFGAPLLAGRVLLTAARQAVRDARTASSAIVAWVVLGVGAYLAWRFLGSQIADTVTAIAALAPLIVTVAGKLKSARGAVERLAKTEQSDIDREIAVKRDRLAQVDGEFALERFLADRSGAGSYREYRGLLGQVHDDLRELSADLSRAREEWAAGDRTGPPPLERIVLYIDDLDRCPPPRVVKVLEAVHLMLALDLFVVVVAVDARWLIRSLERHHRELFAEGDADREAVATPVDYLDKIFQIPFALRPPGPEATANYLRSLLPDPAHADGTSPSGTLPGDSLSTDAPTDGTLPDGAPVALASGAPAAESASPGTPRSAATATPRHVGASFTGVPGLPRITLPMTVPDPPSGLPRPDRQSERPDRQSERLAEPPGRPAAEKEPPAPLPELRPKSLQLTPPEVEFMTSLGGLVLTPRAAKRLVNLYRLVRIGIPDSELSAFTGGPDGDGGPYRAVQVLLAILAGHPKAARAMFSRLLAPDADDDLAAVAESMPFPHIRNELARLRKEQSLTVSTAECQRWCPLLARFSFYTRDLA